MRGGPPPLAASVAAEALLVCRAGGLAGTAGRAGLPASARIIPKAEWSMPIGRRPAWRIARTTAPTMSRRAATTTTSTLRSPLSPVECPITSQSSTACSSGIGM